MDNQLQPQISHLSVQEPKGLKTKVLLWRAFTPKVMAESSVTLQAIITTLQWQEPKKNLKKWLADEEEKKIVAVLASEWVVVQPTPPHLFVQVKMLRISMLMMTP